MHLTPDDHHILVVGDCGDRTLEGAIGHRGRGPYSRRSLHPAGGRQRLDFET